LIIKETIKKLAGLFLLIVFIVGSSPQYFFHEILADHKDVSYQCNHPERNLAHFHQQGIDCKFSGLVVSGVYYFEFKPASFEPFQIPREYSEKYLSCYLESTHLAKANRGPPFVG
jgi:hypothetical protein